MSDWMELTFGWTIPLGILYMELLPWNIVVGCSNLILCVLSPQCLLDVILTKHCQVISLHLIKSVLPHPPIYWLIQLFFLYFVICVRLVTYTNGHSWRPALYSKHRWTFSAHTSTSYAVCSETTSSPDCLTSPNEFFTCCLLEIVW